MRRTGRQHARCAVPVVSTTMIVIHRRRARTRTRAARSVKLAIRMRTASKRQRARRVLQVSTLLGAPRCAVHAQKAPQIMTPMPRHRAYRAWLGLLRRRATLEHARIALLDSTHQHPLRCVQTAQLGRLMMTWILPRLVRAVRLASLLRTAMLVNATLAWLASTRLRLLLSAPTALQGRPTTTCRQLPRASGVDKDSMQWSAMLASATAALLVVSIHHRAARAWMRVSLAWLGHSRALGRQRARSARAGLLMRTAIHRQSALRVLRARIPGVARRSAMSARLARWTVT